MCVHFVINVYKTKKVYNVECRISHAGLSLKLEINLTVRFRMQIYFVLIPGNALLWNVSEVQLVKPGILVLFT